MEPFYLEIRAVHIVSVIASGVLLLVRAIAFNLLNARWAVFWPARMLTYTVDTVLLTAALMLMTIVRQYPFTDSWLTVKLILVVLYFVLSYSALGAEREKTRWLCLAAAVPVYGFIVTVARAQSPLGFLA